MYRVSTLGKHTAIGVPSHVANYADDLYAVVGAPNGAVWYTEEAAERVGRITT